MQADVEWLIGARRDLIEIGADIAQYDERAARRVVARLQRRAARLGEFPFMGRRRKDLGQDLRSLNNPPYTMVYRTVPDADMGPITRVDIVRVVDGRRDLPTLFGRARARR